MKKLMADIFFTLYSLEDFSNPNRCESFINLLLSFEPLRPDEFGVKENSMKTFSGFNKSEFKKCYDDGFLIIKKKSNLKYTLLIENPRIKKMKNGYYFSLVSQKIETEIGVDHFPETEFLTVCSNLFELFDGVYGNIKSLTKGEAPPIENINKFISDVYWANFFGNKYIQLFGEKNLHSTPLSNWKKTSNRSGVLKLDGSLFDPISIKTSLRIKKHLCPMAFKQNRLLPWQKNVVPEFGPSP